MLSQEVDVYYLTGSKIPDKLGKCIDKELNNYSFNFIEISKIKNVKKRPNELVIFEEEDSYLTCVDIYDRIVSFYKEKPIIIIISTNREIFNVVRWIRKGACDYIPLSELKKDVLYNSLKGSYNYSHSINEYQKVTEKKNAANHRVIVPSNIDWNSLVDGEYYDMTLIRMSVIFNKDYIGRYSKASMENIYEKIKNELSHIFQNFSGRIWFWQNNSGIITFHFGDMVNCAVLSALYIYNQFFLLCLEKLKLDEILKFKMTIHNGNCYYHKKNTDQITSDLINTLVHVDQHITCEEELVISENVFNSLSPRLIKFFAKSAQFNKKDTYKYNV
jgi:hypothetical protein